MARGKNTQSTTRTTTKASAQRKRPASRQNSTNAIKSILVAWKRGTLRQRVAMSIIGLFAAMIVLAIIVSSVRFIEWRVEISRARNEQQQLVEEYDFNPGNIISDSQFFNGSAMNTAQIQAFLDEQGAQCTGANCLRTKKFETSHREATEYCDAYSAQSSQSAAEIIAGASQACNISPKVLLTMLQKEQQLITDTDPGDFQYKSAMGLSCPDDDHCDPEYAGFFNQVFGSAERYQYYVNHESDYGFHANALNYIQYNPDTSCGGSQVYIENKATALLYIYTPYQPNIAALKAGAGEGDACSAYGNRNFSIIYSGWFGDPRA